MRLEKNRQQTACRDRASALSKIDKSRTDLKVCPYNCHLLGGKGFTLTEIVTVLAILGLVAGALTPVAYHVIESKKDMTAREELQILKKAVTGEPLSTQWGSEATFGYIGDIGSLPQNLEDLYTRPAGIPSYSYNNTLETGSGWRGPYTAKKSYASVADFLQDPYGETYAYTLETPPYPTDATLGAEIRAIIRSTGWDGTNGTQDDLTVEILKPEILADVAGMVKNAEGVGVPTVSVTINYPSNGTLTSSTAPTDTEGRYQFSDMPLGERTITLSPGLVYVPWTAYATDTEVEFSVANLSPNSITVTSIRATYNVSPTANYTQVTINGTLKQTGTFGSGTTVGFGAETTAASGVPREVSHILLQSPRIEIPDIELSTAGAGGTMAIKLQGFTANMTGIPFTVAFSDGSTVVFTPQKRQ